MENWEKKENADIVLKVRVAQTQLTTTKNRLESSNQEQEEALTNIKQQ